MKTYLLFNLIMKLLFRAQAGSSCWAQVLVNMIAKVRMNRGGWPALESEIGVQLTTENRINCKNLIRNKIRDLEVLNQWPEHAIVGRRFEALNWLTISTGLVVVAFNVKKISGDTALVNGVSLTVPAILQVHE